MRLNQKQTGHEQRVKPLVVAMNGITGTRAANPLDHAYTALIQRAHDTKDFSVLRLPASAKKMGRANSTWWQDVKNGKAPPSIRLGERSVGWLSAELDAILAARALASRTNMPLDIKQFVSILTAPRLSSTDFAEPADGVENA